MNEYRAVVEIYVRAADENAADHIIASIGNKIEEDYEEVTVVDYTDLSPYVDPDPQCVCGVHRSEHQLCGCGDWEVRR